MLFMVQRLSREPLSRSLFIPDCSVKVGVEPGFDCDTAFTWYGRNGPGSMTRLAGMPPSWWKCSSTGAFEESPWYAGTIPAIAENLHSEPIGLVVIEKFEPPRQSSERESIASSRPPYCAANDQA